MKAIARGKEHPGIHASLLQTSWERGGVDGERKRGKERDGRVGEIYSSSFFQFHQSNKSNFSFIRSGKQGIGRESRNVSLGKAFHSENMRNED